MKGNLKIALGGVVVVGAFVAGMAMLSEPSVAGPTVTVYKTPT